MPLPTSFRWTLLLFVLSVVVTLLSLRALVAASSTEDENKAHVAAGLGLLGVVLSVSRILRDKDSEDRMKYRDLCALLRREGCCPVRVSGTHEVWQTPSGRSLPPIPIHAGHDVSVGVRTMVLRALRRSTS